ncbi:hypothetical protein [Halostella sp. PRR32]|uniref:hypothetical protein n=1 Tax=Halostella sp. PRR32 TaxID=3098147 RepID=UPI002B1E4012|nr:hypothetical protein [Halostella sp. PRR32]
MIPFPTSTEDALDYDGPFSTLPEWHAFIIGVHAGVAGEGDTVLAVALGDREAETVAEREIKAEPWYTSGGTLLGLGIQRWRSFEIEGLE